MILLVRNSIWWPHLDPASALKGLDGQLGAHGLSLGGCGNISWRWRPSQPLVELLAADCA